MFKDVLEMFAPFAKAMMPLLVSVGLTGLAAIGVGPEMTVSDAVTLLITAGLVYIIPNKKV